MNAGKGQIEVGFELGKATTQGRRASDNDVIEAGKGLPRGQSSGQGAQTALYPVAVDSTADLLGHGVSKPGGLGSRRVCTRTSLQDESRRTPAPATPDPKKFAALLESSWCHCAKSCPKGAALAGDQ